MTTAGIPHQIQDHEQVQAPRPVSEQQARTSTGVPNVVGGRLRFADSLATLLVLGAVGFCAVSLIQVGMFGALISGAALALPPLVLRRWGRPEGPVTLILTVVCPALVLVGVAWFMAGAVLSHVEVGVHGFLPALGACVIAASAFWWSYGDVDDKTGKMEFLDAASRNLARGVALLVTEIWGFVAGVRQREIPGGVSERMVRAQVSRHRRSHAVRVWEELRRREGFRAQEEVWWREQVAATPAPAPQASTPRLDGASEGAKTPAEIVAPFTRDLTAAAARGELKATVGDEDVMRAVEAGLMRQERRNVVLLGEAGTGKSAAIEALAQRIAAGNVPPALLGRRVVAVDLQALAAGTTLRGQLEERLQALVEWASAERLILGFDELHQIMGVGGSQDGVSGPAQALKPALSDGKIDVLGATTTAEWRHIAKDEALARRFTSVHVPEPTSEETEAILRTRAVGYERAHGVEIPPETVAAAVALSDRYLPNLHRPAKAIDVLDDACARAAAASAVAVTVADIAKTVSALAGGVPVRISETITAADRERVAAVERELQAAVIGQPRAIAAYVDFYSRDMAALGDPDRPPFFLLAGPTGTGKTELAKAVARITFGDAKRLLRIDCGALTKADDVNQLIGSPPGYVDSDKEGQLTGALRRTPYLPVVFDEFEKAHPAIADLLLGLEDGRLVDAHGNTVNARNAQFFFTSNVGSAGAASTPEKTLSALATVFRPELLARMKVIPFDALNVIDIHQVLDIQLRVQADRLRARYHAELIIDQSARDLLLREGYDPDNGVRPLKAAIDENLTRALADAALAGEIVAGSTVHCTAEDSRLVVSTS